MKKAAKAIVIVLSVLLAGAYSVRDCRAMNATGIKRDYAGDAFVTAEVNVNGYNVSWNGGSTETSDFQISGFVYNPYFYRVISYDAYQTSACSFGQTYEFEPSFAQATFNISGYSGSCSLTVTVN